MPKKTKEINNTIEHIKEFLSATVIKNLKYGTYYIYETEVILLKLNLSKPKEFFS